jgi:hypothetical protein
VTALTLAITTCNPSLVQALSNGFTDWTSIIVSSALCCGTYAGSLPRATALSAEHQWACCLNNFCIIVSSAPDVHACVPLQYMPNLTGSRVVGPCLVEQHRIPLLQVNSMHFPSSANKRDSPSAKLRLAEEHAGGLLCRTC